jgi:uncharacterized protein (TIGR03437 family)
MDPGHASSGYAAGLMKQNNWGVGRCALFSLFGFVLTSANAQTISTGGLVFTKLQPNLPTTPGYITSQKAYLGGAVLLWGDVAMQNGLQKHTLYDMDTNGNVNFMPADGDADINGELIKDWYPTVTATAFNTTSLAIQNLANGPSYSANWRWDKATKAITRYYRYNDTVNVKTPTGTVTGKPWYSTPMQINACPTPTGNVDCAIVGLIPVSEQNPNPTKITYLGMVAVNSTGNWQALTTLPNLLIGNVNLGTVYFPFGFAVASDGFDFAETDPTTGGVVQRYNKIVHATWGGKQDVPFGSGLALSDGEIVTTWADVSQTPLVTSAGSGYNISCQTPDGRQVAYVNGGQATEIVKSQDFPAQPNGFVTVASYGSPYFLAQSVYLGNAVFALIGNGQMLQFNNGDKMPDLQSVAIMDGFTLPDGNGAIFYGRDSGGVNFWWWKVIVASTITVPEPTVQFTTSAADIVPGQTVTLNWAITNADTAILMPGFGSVASQSGSQAVSPASTTTYTLTATGAGGVTSSSVTVTVHTGPYITAMTDLMGYVKTSYAQTEFVTLYGNELCGQTATASAPFGNRLGNCQVQLSDGSLAVLQYVSPVQVNLMLPNVSVGAYTLKVIDWTSGNTTLTFPVTISAISPTLVVNSSGVSAIYDNTSGQVVYGGPINPGDAITYYLTGLGLTDANLPLGSAGVGNVVAPVLAFLNSQGIKQGISVIAAVSSPDFPGLYQVSVQLPVNAGADSNGLMSIQVGGNMLTSRIVIF